MTSSKPTGPVLLEPIAKGRAWGGKTFVQWSKFKAPAPGQLPIGESWELADLPESIAEGRSRVAAGAGAGKTLHELVDRDTQGWMGRARLTPQGRFPLLVKFLDAAEHLSVQVHPNEEYAAINPTAHLKTESWFVLAAKPGAMIWRGIKEQVTKPEFEQRLRSGASILDLLVEVRVQTGDCIDLPSGLCHALGEGITVAEIQTPSDTTFRVFDWNRNDPSRQLHIDQAMACMQFGRSQRLEHLPIRNASTAPAVQTLAFRTTLLCRTDHYKIERIEAMRATNLEVITHQRPVCWLVLGGSVTIEGDVPVAAKSWETLLFPASAEGRMAKLGLGTTFLRITLPDPMDRFIA
ncbi:MAG: class I mannose-6-phosphate isomerase [Planctomycetes bacterium]|nr:class I mannose-6-phosphate isomerase [Planctomycetota bacterium]